MSHRGYPKLAPETLGQISIMAQVCGDEVPAICEMGTLICALSLCVATIFLIASVILAAYCIAASGAEHCSDSFHTTAICATSCATLLQSRVVCAFLGSQVAVRWSPGHAGSADADRKPNQNLGGLSPSVGACFQRPFTLVWTEVTHEKLGCCALRLLQHCHNRV